MIKNIFNLGLYFEHVSKKFKSSIAIEYQDNEITFGELNNLSSKIGNFLKAEIKNSNLVCIFNDKSIFSYAIMIACLKCGFPYCNVDPNSPQKRLKKIFKIAKPKIVFSFKKINKELVDFLEKNDLKTFYYDEQSYSKKIYSFNSSLKLNKVLSNEIAYVMFTSGSTGIPKGVAISHQNVINFIRWGKEQFKITRRDRFPNLNQLYFDNSVFDFYVSLFNGASIISIEEGIISNPFNLLNYIYNKKCTIWFSVPSFLIYCLKLRAIEYNKFSSVRNIIFGGEVFPKKYLLELFNKLPDKKLTSVYGPTECTCICSSYEVSKNDFNNQDYLPLGFPANNFNFEVVDDNLNEVEVGSIGELLIKGPNVGIGYLNDITQTKEVFIKKKKSNGFSEIIYKSGDLVYQNQKNLPIFVGRKDNQIKKMGYRIELEEIDNAFFNLNSVKEALCVSYKDELSVKIIAAVVSDASEKEILNDLRKYIPKYMIPDQLIFYKELPKNPNGKLNRKKIKEELEI